ncbi:hypothetical protein BV25DRAFT_1917187 [Artomyces pyxidatus]|uniref:Uncharacterized protein n=1 Tax=Artomyces pyxidatus TaxID=48021 RepID=A0ACB8SXR5_9AGAM|nr:hypothetical protein BV25DRAFT_1917187 [Artomyces pyxidatus]
MSDSEGDFENELLELAGATEKKRKRRQSSSKNADSKRRKPDLSMDSASDGDEPESEEEDTTTNPYPLEGKYVDEADRHRLMELPEIEREEVLAQRLEEMQRIQDKRNLDQMLKAQKGGDGESVSKAAKRQHAVRGATKEKSRKLDELKARRKAKDEKKRTRNSPKRDRSSSPMEMETDDEEDEDGQITRYEQEEEKERKLLKKANPEEEALTIDDLVRIQLTRDMIAKHCRAPWFEDYLKGAWVRYLIGQDPDGQPVYRACEIEDLHSDLVKPYKINDQMLNQLFLIKHGHSVNKFPMDKVSNSTFTQREFERIIRVCQDQNVKLPTKRQIEKKAAQIAKLVSQPFTESDIAAMLLRKSQMQAQSANKHTSAWMEKSRLNQERSLALKRNDRVEVARLDAKLAELAAQEPTPVVKQLDEEDINAKLARVNERNRKANLEAVRRAELQEMERKRRERRIAAQGGTPTIDPSARLKIVPRLFASRSGTPNHNGTPAAGTPRSVSPLPPVPANPSPPLKSHLKRDVASRALDNIELDLGDF